MPVADRPTKRTSFNESQPVTLEFVVVWSNSESKKEAAECACHLGLCLASMTTMPAGPSQWQGDDAQGNSSKAPKDKPSGDNDDGSGDYHVFYHHLGIN
jgi:hypothetical protein